MQSFRFIFIVATLVSMLCHVHATAFNITVVQYTPVWKKELSGPQNVAINTKEIVTRIAFASRLGSKVIVFPEGSNSWFSYLMGFTSEATRKGYAEYGEVFPPLPFRDACKKLSRRVNPQLYALSCAAMKYNITVISNLVEIEPCDVGVDDCPADGQYQWNSDVIIAPGGHIETTYHKSHLAGTVPFLNQPKSPKMVVYETVFGAKLGFIICQDLIFSDTARFYDFSKVDTIVWNAAYGNLPPVVMALQMMQSLSMQLGVNVVGSDLDRVGGGVIQSGGKVMAWNYANDGTQLKGDMVTGELHTNVTGPPQNDLSRLHHVPKKRSSDDETSACTFGPYPIACTEIVVYNRTMSIQTDKGLTCTIEYELSEKSQDERWALVGAQIVDEKPNTIDIPQYHICALVKCDNFPSCNPYGGVTKSTWKSVSITSTFQDGIPPLTYGSISRLGSWSADHEAFSFAQDELSHTVFTTKNFTVNDIHAAVVLSVTKVN